MNATYTLTEGNDALNRVLLMMRYDMGKTLDENVITEQVYTKTNDGNYELKVGPFKGVDASKIFPNLKQNEYPKKLDSFYSPIGGIPDDVLDFNRFRPSISPEPYKYTEFGYAKSHAYYPRWKKEWQQKHPNQKFGQHQQQTMDRNGSVRTITADEYGNEVRETKKLTFDEFMEELREAAYSWTGIGVDMFLTGLGLPEVGIAVFGLLLAYDIKLWIDGEPDYFNIFCDTLGVISGGAYLAELKGLKMSGKAFKSFGEIFQYLSKKMKPFWNKIKPLFTGIGEGLGKLSEWVTKGIKWLSSKITPKFIKELGPDYKEFLLMVKSGASNILSFLKKLTKAIFDGIENLTYSTAKKIGAGEKVAKAGGKATKGTAAAYTIAKGVVEPIATPIMQKKAEKELTTMGGDIEGDYDD
jgi:hypothetical protein